MESILRERQGGREKEEEIDIHTPWGRMWDLQRHRPVVLGWNLTIGRLHGNP